MYHQAAINIHDELTLVSNNNVQNILGLNKELINVIYL